MGCVCTGNICGECDMCKTLIEEGKMYSKKHLFGLYETWEFK